VRSHQSLFLLKARYNTGSFLREDVANRISFDQVYGEDNLGFSDLEAGHVV
jgi:hypothetical protein